MTTLQVMLLVLAAAPAAPALRAAGPAPAAVTAEPADDAVTAEAVDQALAAIADYDLGKSRAPLAAVEALLRRIAGRDDLRRRAEQGLIRLLDPAVPLECRLFVCRQLAVIGGEAAIPALAKMLADEKTAHMAAYALGRSPGPKADEALLAALATARSPVVILAANLLGDRRAETAREALARLLASDDAAVAEAAAAALGKISGPEAAAALTRFRRTADRALRPAVTDACLQCAEGLAAKGRPGEASAIYRDLLADTEPPLVRRAALSGLMALGGADAVPLALSVLGGDDAALQATAIAHIRSLAGPGVTERFATELPKLPPALQALLIAALADRGDPAARPAVTACAAGPDADVRAAALKALGRLGDASSVAPLARAAAEAGTDAEKRAALTSLRGLSADGADAALLEQMRAAPPPARADLIDVLHDRGATAAVPTLLKEAGAAHGAVRTAALRALGRLAGPANLPALLGLLVGLQGDAGRAEVEAAVVAVARKGTDDPARAGAVLAALPSAGPEAKGSLLGVLRGLGGAQALGAVRAALGDADPTVRDAAVRALAGWSDAAALEPLLAVFRAADTGAAHRVVALRGCVRLLGRAGGPPTAARLQTYADLAADARRPEDRTLLIAGLADVHHPRALKILEPYLADPAVRAEASLAALSVAKVLAGACRGEVREAMGRLAAATPDADVRRQAEDVARQVAALDDSLTGWLVAGPYAEEGKGYAQLFDTVFPPEDPSAGDVPWRVLAPGPNPGRPAVFDLLAACGGGEERVAYVRTALHSDRDQDARLELGTDDGCKVWLNAALVHQVNTGRACVPGSDRADVRLRKGWNILQIKITQNTGPWGFCARLAGRDGRALAAVRADPLHE